MRNILNNPSFKLILGSSSMSRRHILAEMGYEFTIMTADIDEKGIRRENPEELVMVLAEAKEGSKMIQDIRSGLDYLNYALLTINNVIYGLHSFVEILQADAIISKVQTIDYKNNAEATLLITADQVVVYEGIIREKPCSKEEARQFIKGYSGGHASTVGFVLVTNLKTGTRKGAVDKAEVYFHDIPDEVIENLIEEGVVLNVAGGLLLEHPLTSPFVEAVVGTADSVMGLPKAVTEKLIQEAL